jgi:two-component system, cell cycle response regulator
MEKKPASTILIVDDELAAHENLRSLLKDQGYNLIFSTNGLDAINKALSTTPDLILLDVMMPEIDGFNVCRQFRKDPKLYDIPIIMLTALDDHKSRLKGIEVGADDFISKPYDRLELRARVKTITDLNRHKRLLNERRKFEWVVDQATDGYVIINEEDEILYANAKACNYLGIPVGSTITSSFLNAATKKYQCKPSNLWEVWPGTISDQPRYLLWPETANSSPLYLQVNVMELPSNSDIEYLIHLQDITESLISKRRSWQFHHAINHKLRTSLNGLVSGLEVVQLEAENLTEETAEFLRIAYGSAEKLQGELNNILKYMNSSNLATSGEQFRAMDFYALVGDVSKQIGVESKIIINSNCLKLKLKLSREAIETIVLQILENSKKFHPQKSPYVEISIARANNLDDIVVKIMDNGVNLPPSDIEHLCEAYYQHEKFTTGEIEGMGLGLTIVNSVVSIVGGSCRIYNRENMPGLVVELVLPAEPSNTPIDRF